MEVSTPRPSELLCLRCKERIAIMFVESINLPEYQNMRGDISLCAECCLWLWSHNVPMKHVKLGRHGPL